MHMHMVIQLLVPGMEDLDNAGDSTEVSGVGRKLQEGLGTACMQEAVEELLVAVQKRVQVMGEGKDHMEIRASITSARRLSTQTSVLTAWQLGQMRFLQEL